MMFRKSNVNKAIFLVSLKYREIITTKTITLYINKLYFFLKVLKQKQEKEAGTNFVLLCQSRNAVGQFRKTYLHRPVKTLHFLTPARIQKCLI